MTDTAQSLAKISENWLDPLYPLREETIQALQVSTGFSRRQIEIALANCFSEITLPKITAYVASFAQGKRSNTDVFHILPSNVFTAWVHGAVITLLFGRRCLLKPSSREPVFARAWKKSLADVDPSLAERVEILAWDEKRLHDSLTVVAYGADETLQKIRAVLPLGVSFAGYGHKLSVGTIFKEALDENSNDLLERVRRDVEPFRLQGCLSPQILYIEAADYSRWPELEVHVDVMPKLKTFTSWFNVLQDLEKFTPYLSCVGYAGLPERETFLESQLRDSNVIRICPLGEMQRPPLSWRNGGIDLGNLLHSMPVDATRHEGGFHD